MQNPFPRSDSPSRGLVLGGLLASGLLLSPPAHAQLDGDLDHRDELRMNSISGSDFRNYISENIPEDDRWAHSMRTFGTFHNHMHEMMSDFARHAMERLGDEGRVPAFENRISGGEWGEYRANLEDAEVVSAWADFVRITEIMHDRVHHAMYTSAAYDRELRGRDVELSAYVGDRAPYAPEEVSLDRTELTMEYASSDALRALVWHQDIEDERLHAAMQKLMVFDEMLSSLMTEWALHGAEKDAAACRPPEFDARMGGDRWKEYATTVEACDDAHWRQFVQVVGLMHDRIHDMMYRAILHDAEFHGDTDRVRGLMVP